MVGQSHPNRILLIEDDEELVEIVQFHLQELGVTVDSAENAEHATQKIQEDLQQYALIILDLMLPDGSGYEICKAIRVRSSLIPILILSAKSENLDKVLGLELGADDYLTKPYSSAELIARVRALLRRAYQVEDARNTSSQAIRNFGPLKIDSYQRKVWIHEQTIELTPREYDLLLYLTEEPDRPKTREELVHNVWGYDFAGYDQTVSSHISRLRAKLSSGKDQAPLIQTVWGVGYRFVDPDANEQ